MKTMSRSEHRLLIAISLLRGKLVIPDRDGYDPVGFKRKEKERVVQGALDMAEELIEQNEAYGKKEENLEIE